MPSYGKKGRLYIFICCWFFEAVLDKHGHLWFPLLPFFSLSLFLPILTICFPLLISLSVMQQNVMVSALILAMLSPEMQSPCCEEAQARWRCSSWQLQQSPRESGGAFRWFQPPVSKSPSWDVRYREAELSRLCSVLSESLTHRTIKEK